ncbi:NADP-dependent oxidoreductase [Endozoicomonas sp. SM1973]|uniref:NADP-dependent oxidoreductase n=1 Tax=Spartinivicinus marinus TaxID=2994442 RepID=A0A853I5A0_9GAMM|nr:NADP-dependent oxidoreductase [Spartinivicinus marinus]MCX4026893.1 NADP-dependent oxidoreductase [Spartinivicinus marinus]NYZ66762.1 NADP-dependent oxidoreductase [Spartinivicinus marinus]
MTTYKVINLIKRPLAREVSAELFEVVDKEIPTTGPGEVLVRQTHMSLDPAMLGWMSSDKNSYMPPVELGSVMRSSGVGIVVRSNHPEFTSGDRVMGRMGWQEYFLSDGDSLNKVTATLPDEAVLSILGLPGLTATQGFLNMAKPSTGETLIITGAAGAVGSMVGQLAKAHGLNVIGVVGSDEKAHWITTELGFDGAINYKKENIEKQLAQLAPKGIDIFYENTGGPIQKLIIERMNPHGRVIVCGLIADYGKVAPPVGPSWMNVMKKRLSILGFTMTDHYSEISSLLAQLIPYVEQGKLKYRAHVIDGLESAITGLNLLFTGKNQGKLIVKL